MRNTRKKWVMKSIDYIIRRSILKPLPVNKSRVVVTDEGGLSQPGSRQGEKSSSLWCGCASCGRRSLLTSLGGALLSGIGNESLLAAEVVDSNADVSPLSTAPA